MHTLPLTCHTLEGTEIVIVVFAVAVFAVIVIVVECVLLVHSENCSHNSFVLCFPREKSQRAIGARAVACGHVLRLFIESFGRMAVADREPDKGKEPQMKQNGYSNHEVKPVRDVDRSDEGYVEMVVPPDGGWGWVVVAASFMCNLVVDGIMFSFGVFLSPLSQHFGVSKASVSLAGSLQTGFYLMAGPFVSALANRYGFRLVAIVGSVIACLSFVLSHFATSIEFMYVTYGIMGGIGAGLIYVPAVITTGFYFEKWRALATGISVCGSGIGAFVLAPISQQLIDSFEWKGAILIQAGMLLNCAVFGAMFRPLKPKRVKVAANPETVASGIELRTTIMSQGVSTASLHASQPITNRFFGTNNNTEYPTAAQALGSVHDIGANSSSSTSRSLHSLHKAVEMRTLERQVSASENRLSVPIYPELEVVDDEELKSVEEENNLLDGDADRLNGKVPTIRRHTISDRRSRADSVTSHKSFKADKRRGSVAKEPQRPFYRDDIFYGGSLNRLPHYRSQLSSVGYHMSVTRLPTAKDVAEEESGSCYLCPESVRRILSTMLDLSLLKSPSFLILAISGGLTMTGFYTPFVYITDRARAANLPLDETSAMWLVSIIGIGNTIGRVALGFVSSLPGVDALLINNVFITISGLLTMLSGLWMTRGYQFFYSAAFGLSVSVFASLRSILVVDLLGLEKLTNAFGLLLLFQGLGATIGAPLAGAFKDFTDSYDASFFFAGTLIVLSAAICYPLKKINNSEKSKDAASNDEELAKS
ncbi:monocarboxylate transporter 3 isoform X2 [Phymastichus coffea]|uniref:monocarboxylate transporter 3 isoform X2 n=1 Tax=Phymastichus coffea TaxID=108790 RepID=UPI00273C2A2D|nr:monocarboxylate transporter 3 isoform X2 [Phymastichus coffea]